MFENPINKLRFWCHKVIPLVYDEALSYYEVLCKVAKKINEVITDVNTLHDTVVFQVNGKEPTDGNVELDAGDFSGAFVGSINGITPEEDGSITIDAEDVGAMPADESVVKTINGISPNADGSILAGTVRSINGKSPTALPTPGSVTLNASDVGALPNSIDPVESVNGIAPDAQGNVNVGTVKSVNSTLPDANGNVNLPTVAGVTSVDGVGADAQGNVQINAVKSVNGETPNAQGAVTIDVGTVKSVNGETPDAQGAVTIDVGTVKSVNSKTPDALGAVTLVPSDIGAVPVEGRLVQGTWDDTKVDTTYANTMLNLYVKNGICFINARFKALVALANGDVVATGLPTRPDSASSYLPAICTVTPYKNLGMSVSSTGNLRMFYIGGVEAGDIVYVTGSYPVRDN